MPDDTMTADAVVVEGGPRPGTAAALELARRAATWCWWSAGPTPAPRTCTAAWCTGGILNASCRQWWTEVPVQRWVTRRATMVINTDPGADGRLPYQCLGSPAV